jgi:hypothetical protein
VIAAGTGMEWWWPIKTGGVEEEATGNLMCEPGHRRAEEECTVVSEAVTVAFKSPTRMDGEESDPRAWTSLARAEGSLGR